MSTEAPTSPVDDPSSNGTLTDLDRRRLESRERESEEREQREAYLQRISEGDSAQKPEPPPNNPPPSTPAELLAECEKYRDRIAFAVAKRTPCFPCTNANFAAAIKGELNGHMLPDMDRLYDAAVVLNVLCKASDLPGEPQTGREALGVLDSLIGVCRAKPESLPPTKAKVERIKEPCKDALTCYRLHIALGQKQSTLADRLSRELGRPIIQPQVSRWIGQVKAWLNAGNILPDLTAPSSPAAKVRTISVDPATLDRGAGRSNATRHRSNSGNDELQQLIAEQGAEMEVDEYDSSDEDDDD